MTEYAGSAGPGSPDSPLIDEIYRKQNGALDDNPRYADDAREPAPVDRALARLASTLDGLEKLVAILGEKLNPVLSPAPAEGAEPTDRRPKDPRPVGIVAKVLGDEADHVDRIVQRVSEILHRLDV